MHIEDHFRRDNPPLSTLGIRAFGGLCYLTEKVSGKKKAELTVFEPKVTLRERSRAAVVARGLHSLRIVVQYSSDWGSD